LFLKGNCTLTRRPQLRLLRRLRTSAGSRTPGCSPQGSCSRRRGARHSGSWLSCLKFCPHCRCHCRVYDDFMATWEDGPEYAPIERPADFQTPDAPPLEIAPPYTQAAAWAPKGRPIFDNPSEKVAPLGSLVPLQREEPRDPQKPFAVVTTTMTSDSAWGAVHWSSPRSQPAGPAASGSFESIAGAVYPPPDQPIALRGGTDAGPAGFPAPGTPGWFAPGPHDQQPQPTNAVTAKAVLDAATPGLCMCLIIGGLVYVLSPIILCICVGLAGRVKVATAEVRRAHTFGLVVLAIMGVLGGLIVGTDFADWWRFLGQWSLLICWVLLVGTLATIYRRLRSQPPSPPPYQSPWR
jgi:hypothetical protein